MNKQDKPRQGIAIIGMSCWYPGAQSLVEFWENILAKRQQFRRLPDVRLPLDHYQDSNRTTPDKTYGTEAAVLDGFEFDWKGRHIPKQVFESTDIVHWLALEVALKALDDSGLDLAKLQTQQTGVILGNTLTGEWTRTNAMRMRWPYIERVMRETAAAKGMAGEGLESYISSVEEAFKSVFPTINEDTLAGALSNTIAGRICNFLDLHGGGYTVDGACSSSLIAVITAARNLSNGDLDVAFAGGIDISLDSFELIGFAKTGALTPDEMRVYDRRANGFVPGEGCGFVVMKRLKDAVRDGDRIYSVLQGWGLSSDGKGGMTAPSVNGQAMAIAKAYEMAGFGLELCDFIEGHGTGTTVGDNVEISALVQALGDKTPAHGIGLTSLKSVVGHTKAAAGIGAFIKTAIALNQRILPPMAGVEEPNAHFQEKARAFFPIMRGKKYADDAVMRAGVSAMGFGGINSHTVLESYGEPAAHLRPSMDEAVLFSSYDRAEILVFSAHSQTLLQKKIQQTLQIVRFVSRAELGDLAADLSRFISQHEAFRASVVITKPEDAWLALNKLHRWLDAPMPLQESREQIEGAMLLSLGHSSTAPRLGFLFPGQGAQKLNMAKKLVQRHEWAKDRADEADSITREISDFSLLAQQFAESGVGLEEATKRLSSTELAQPGISLTNALWLEALQRLGLQPHAVGGHSLGELSALYAARTFDFATFIKLAARRGQLMAFRADQPGAMLHLACDAATAENFMNGVPGYSTIASRNAPDQTVVSGDPQVLEAILKAAKLSNIQGGMLPVSNAFHSALMQEAAAEFRQFMENLSFKNPQLAFYRGTDGSAWTSEMNLKSYLSQQILQQVDFIALAQAMAKETDLLIEVGPSHILSGLTKGIHGLSVSCLPTESRPGFDWDFKVVLAVSFAKGSAIRWNELYSARFLRPFVRPDTKLFIQSPTERSLKNSENKQIAPLAIAAPFKQQMATATNLTAPAPAAVVSARPGSAKDIERVIYKIIGELTGFELGTLNPSMRLLDDLNMDSIKASELGANVAMHYGIAGELQATIFANASIGEIAEAIRRKIADTATESAAMPEKVIGSVPVVAMKRIAETSLAKNLEPWVRNFSEVFLPQPLSQTEIPQLTALRVDILGSFDNILEELGSRGAEVQALKESRKDSMARDLTIIALPPASDDEAEDMRQTILLLSQVGQARWKKNHSLVFVQWDDGKFGRDEEGHSLLSAKAFAQSMAYERPYLKIRCVSLPALRRNDSQWIVDRIAAEHGGQSSLAVVAYDIHERRLVPELQLDEPATYVERSVVWEAGDVIVVSGGAKGITAACALAFAKEHGTCMALLGSSRYGEAEMFDPEHPISKTLISYRNAGLLAVYYACDITDEDSVKQLMQTISCELGKPVGLIHGAGVNQPRQVSTVSAADAIREMAPKVDGMRNLLNALQGESLKLIIGFTSVIGVIGMPGNAWYGFANESLDLMLRRYARQQPNTKTQTLAYSVWAELGMGARMSSDKNLEQKGISGISPAQGIRRFIELSRRSGRDQQTVICSRLGSIGDGRKPEFQAHDLAAPFHREILHFHLGVECIARTQLNWEEHDYLLDHNFKGTIILPTVHGLEAMSQIVSMLQDLSQEESFVLENIQLTRPIIVGAQGCTVEIHAQILEQDGVSGTRRIRAGIRTALTGFKIDHFAADFVLRACQSEQIEGIPGHGLELAVDPAKQLYGSILFQGEKFQRLQTLHHLESDNETQGSTVFRSKIKQTDQNRHILGDPFFRDSLLQSAQIIIPQNQCLPIEIERLELHRGFRQEKTRTCFTDVHKADEKTYLATITVFDESGAILERLVNYRLQFLEKRPQLPKAMDLIQANPFVKETVRVEKPSRSPVNQDLLAPYRAIAERLLIDAEADGPQGQSVFVHRFIPDFKTFSNLSRSIYFSHFFNWMGSAREMSSLPVLDKIRALTETGRWGLVTNWSSIEVLGECRNKDRVVEARMWCGEISGSKNSSATLSFDWVSKGEDGIEERIATGQMGFTWVEILGHGVVRPAEFPDYYKEFIASMIARNDSQNTYIPAHEPYLKLSKGESIFKVAEGPNTAVVVGQKLFETSLFDANLVGNLYFGNYSIWMGKLRDSYFYSVAPSLYRGLGEAGEFTCVKSRIQHLREAMPFDEILVTMALKAIHQNGVDLQFEFYKVSSDGMSEKLAIGDHQAIWTRQGADGEKFSCEMPQILRDELIQQMETTLLKKVVVVN